MFIEQNTNMQKGDLLGDFKSHTMAFDNYSLKLLCLCLWIYIYLQKCILFYIFPPLNTV